MAEKQKSRIGESFNMFISLEFRRDPEHRELVDKVEEFQARTLSMFPAQQGKAARLGSLHVTLATLSVREDEVEFVIQSIADAMEQFKRIFSEEDGLRANFHGISTHNNVVVMNMALGANTVQTLRDTLMLNGISKFQTDVNMIHPHLTFARNLNLTEAEQGALLYTLDDAKTSRITFDVLSLRQRKQAGESLQPPIRQFALWKE